MLEGKHAEGGKQILAEPGSLNVKLLSNKELCKVVKLCKRVLFLSFLRMLRTLFFFQRSWSLEVEYPLKSTFQHNYMSNLARQNVC